MVRGRTSGRGARRGAAASTSQRAGPAADKKTSTEDAATPSEPAASTPATLDEAVASASGSAGATTRRGGAAAGARTTAGGRLRPKILRRDEAERDKLALQEAQKANERAAAERKARGRSRGRSKRARGDAMGSRGRGGIITASGPFSGGFSGAGGAKGGWFGGGSGAAGGGGFYGGSNGGKSEGKGKPGFGEADARMREARINADKLNAMTPEEELDSDDEAMLAALSNRNASTMPMGIYRREHKDQGVIVATTAEVEAAENAMGEEEESLWVDGEGSGTLPPVDQPEEGQWDAGANSTLIKKEPDTEDAMDLDIPTKPSSVEEKRKTAPAVKVKKDVPKDAEEKIIQTDLDLLAGELGAVTVTDEAGEITIEGPSNKDGRLYLFQFPPFIPPLKEVARPRAGTKVKEESRDSDLLDTPSTSDPAPVDLTRESSGHNGEEEDDDEDDELEAEGFRSQFLSHGGMVGKLNVRKSGKVELDWGGMTLEMSPAAGMNFLTTAVIVEEGDEKPQQNVVSGDSVGMGKIMGRFVLAPIWSEEEDWDVAPEDLVAD